MISFLTFFRALLMLLENVPLLNFSRYLVTAAGETEFHLHSLLVFLSQSGLPRAHIRWDGPPGLVWGRYMGFSTKTPLSRKGMTSAGMALIMALIAWGTEASVWVPPLMTLSGQRKKSNSSFPQMWQNTMSYRPSALCCPTSQNLQNRNKC